MYRTKEGCFITLFRSWFTWGASAISVLPPCLGFLSDFGNDLRQIRQRRYRLSVEQRARSAKVYQQPTLHLLCHLHTISEKAYFSTLRMSSSTFLASTERVVYRGRAQNMELCQYGKMCGFHMTRLHHTLSARSNTHPASHVCAIRDVWNLKIKILYNGCSGHSVVWSDMTAIFITGGWYRIRQAGLCYADGKASLILRFYTTISKHSGKAPA